MFERRRRRAGREIKRAERGIERTLRDNPLALGAVAIAVGAAIGLALPHTPVEDEWMGQAKERLVRRAEGAAGAAIETAERKVGQLTSGEGEGERGEDSGQLEQRPVRMTGGARAARSAPESLIFRVLALVALRGRVGRFMARAFPKKPPAPFNATPLDYTEKTAAVQSYLPEIINGVAATMSHFFKNTRDMIRGSRPDPVTERWADGITTISYPEQKRPYPERFRGVHRLTARDDKSVRCVACLCCSTACPAQCIYIEAGE